MVYPGGVAVRCEAYGFAKSDRANIDSDEEKQFKDAARHIFRLTAKQIAELVKEGDFVEVKGHEQEISKYAMGAIHETMEALHKVGAIDKQTMRRLDNGCL
jgi:RelE toxin of RelE / RelB toxin-antitoxin system